MTECLFACCLLLLRINAIESRWTIINNSFDKSELPDLKLGGSVDSFALSANEHAVSYVFRITSMQILCFARNNHVHFKYTAVLLQHVRYSMPNTYKDDTVTLFIATRSCRLFPICVVSHFESYISTSVTCR